MTKSNQATAFRRALRDLELTQGQFRELLNRSASAIPGIAPVSADTISRYATGRYGVSAGVAAFLATLEVLRSRDKNPTQQLSNQAAFEGAVDERADILVQRFAAIVNNTQPSRLARIERMLRIMESEVTAGDNCGRGQNRSG